MALMDKLALLHNLPDELRDDAHTVREYGNSVVHADGRSKAAITFQQSLSHLNHFLSALP